MDCASIDLRHVRLDENGRYTETIDSDLNNCLGVEANIDQTSQDFMMDVVLSMLDEGAVAVVPTDTNDDIRSENTYKIYTMRTAKILEWFPRHVRVLIYDDHDGIKKEVILPKESVAIIPNPLYAVINEPNSTMQRLIRKLNILDAIDEQSGSGKLDLIIQLPYVVKTPMQEDRANMRRKSIEEQLSGSKYGIAYIDSSEKVTQINRSVENNLMGQIEYLTSMLYSQLGFTQGILEGSADDNTMTNYYSRIIEPILSAITREYTRKFLTQTARTQKQSIMYFRDPFKLVPVTQIPNIADKLTRNEIMSSNEIRQIIGMKPSDDPNADALINKNINHPGEEKTPAGGDASSSEGEGDSYDAIVNELLESLEGEIDSIIARVTDDEDETPEEEEDEE